MGWILFFFLLKKGKKIIRWCHSCCRCIYNQVKWVKASEVAEEDNKHKKAPTFEMFTATKRVSFCATQRNRTHEILLSVEKNFRKCLSNSIFLLLASVKIPVMSATQKWLTGWLTRRHFLMGKCGKFLRTVYGVLIISESERKNAHPLPFLIALFTNKGACRCVCISETNVHCRNHVNGASMFMFRCSSCSPLCFCSCI